MRRYLIHALIISVLSASVTFLLYEFGVMGRASAKLAVFYANAGFLDGHAQPDRIIQTVVYCVMALLAAWAVIDIAKLMEKLIVVLGLGGAVVSTSALLAVAGVYFEPFSSLSAIFMSTILGFAYAQTEGGRRKAVLEQVLGGRVSRLGLGSLLNGPPPEVLRGIHREVTVLTVRTLNHNDLRKAVPPEDLVEMTNLFLKHSSDFLISRGAYIDESSPECVRAFFGLFQRGTDHRVAACEAAIKLRQRMANLNSELERKFFNRLDYGIAIGCDEVTLGIYRSERSAKLSAVGEVIEQVRILSAANRVYGSQILLSARIYSFIRDHYAMRPMEMIVDPKTGVMSEVYELVEAKDRMTPEDEEARKQFWQGVILYREGKGEEALRIFSGLKNRYPHDRPLQYFIDRAQMTLVRESEHKPHSDESMRGHARVMNTI